MNPEQQQILLKENKSLRIQLREATIKIQALQHQIQSLQSKLAVYENEETTFNQQSFQSQEQIFTQSSHSNDNYDPYEDQQQEFQFSPIKQRKMQERTPKVIFNYNSDGKQPHLILQPHRSQKVQGHLSSDSNEKRYSIKKDDETPKYHVSNRQKQDRFTSQTLKGLFHKTKSTKKIFETFFVTGYSSNLTPEVSYYFPETSIHFEALLSLMYNENSLKVYENIVNAAKSPKFTQKLGKFIIKDTFVIPLRKGDTEQKQYLVACQAEDYYQSSDKTIYSFSRMFSFITTCNFFGAFKQILEQFIQKINSNKGSFFSLSPLPSSGDSVHDYLKQILQQHLQILWIKTIEENQYANFGLGSQIKVFIDIPSLDNSYKTLIDFNGWEILSLQISVSDPTELIRTNLLGFLIIYWLSETKILLYSSSKSKISEAILHATEFIKPLQYVNPIIMAAIKDDHQEYFEAPMSLVLGLWTEVRSKKKQKLEIFLNKKPCLSGKIEEGKLDLSNGVVFNLDTGYTFGGSLSPEKNQLALDLNSLVNNYCKGFDKRYKVFDKLLKGSMGEGSDMKTFKSRLLQCIQNTQLYSFYKQKYSKIHK